jgi:hypothetical protein
MWSASLDSPERTSNTFPVREYEEYSIMARSKSIPGSSTGRSKKNKEQTSAAADIPEMKAAEGSAETAPEMKVPAVEDNGRFHAENRNHGSELASGSNGNSETKSALETKAGSENRKFEVVKSESRKNLVPINLEDEIRRRAYELYEQRGAGAGNEAEDWFTAEREVRQRYRQQSA